LQSFVTNKRQSWELYNQAKDWGQQPADLLGIQDDYVAFCVNEAVYYCGNYINNELEKIVGRDREPAQSVGNRKNHRLSELLAESDGEVKYRNPQVGRG
jgi:hypothetical protein